MRTSLLRRDLPFLVALMVGSVGSLEGQSLTAFGGFAGGGPGSGGLLIGLELRTPELGRLSAAAAGSAWQFIGVGCDLIIGARCEESAKALDIGPVVRLTPGSQSWRLEATARLGGLWYNGEDSGVWNPSAGLGFGFGQLRRVGGLLSLHYHALTSSRPSNLPHPPTDDHLVVTAGLQVRF